MPKDQPPKKAGRVVYIGVGKQERTTNRGFVSTAKLQQICLHGTLPPLSPSPMSKGGIWYFLGLSVPFDADHGLVTSPVVSSLTLAVIRLTLAVYTLVVIIVDLVWLSVEVPPSADASSKAAACVLHVMSHENVG